MALDMDRFEMHEQPLSERSARVERLAKQGLFWLSGPLWVVADEDRITADASGAPVLTDPAALSSPPPGRTESVILFTEQRLAPVILRPGRATACIPSPGRLAGFLR